ncbi:AbrB family transcriptional regulator [Brevibacillus sp. SYSU BS000544]|uniref:AbrB family transcriptional regulator n=1 Tax=Brevibacillus sp. SYSU BS000544 TaxID=3416443 RepID=UPI003CE4FAE5
MKIMETFLVALVGAVFFTWLHIPLAWTLGPIAAVIGWRTATKRELQVPSFFVQLASVLFGYMLGTSFTRETAWQILQQLPLMLITTISVIIVSLGLGYLVSRKNQIDFATGLFGSVPGGLTQMIVAAEEVRGVDISVVSFMQTIRLLSVIFVIPFVTVHGLATEIGEGTAALHSPVISAGGVQESGWIVGLLFTVACVVGLGVGKKLHLPAFTITGPLLGTAILAIVLHIHAPPLPHVLLLLSQLIFGAYIGLLLQFQQKRNYVKLGLFTITSSLILLVGALVISNVLSYTTGSSLTTTFLSAAPGGMAEMGLTATLVHADLSTVSSYQMFRLFFIMFAVPPVLKWWILRQRNKQKAIS